MHSLERSDGFGRNRHRVNEGYGSRKIACALDESEDTGPHLLHHHVTNGRPGRGHTTRTEIVRHPKVGLGRHREGQLSWRRQEVHIGRDPEPNKATEKPVVTKQGVDLVVQVAAVVLKLDYQSRIATNPKHGRLGCSGHSRPKTHRCESDRAADKGCPLSIVPQTGSRLTVDCVHR